MGALHVPRFSLTVSGSHVFFLMLVAAAERPAPSDHDPPENRLIGLDLAAQGKLLFTPAALRDCWWHFGCVLVVDGDDVYVCLWEQAAVPAMHVACLRGGRWQWMRRVGHGLSLAAETEIGRTHHLLTLAGNTLYVHADLGAVAAISKWDGQLKWVTKYLCATLSVDDLRGRPWYVWCDLTPCIWHARTAVCCARRL